MPRIRTIKPEFCTSPDTARLSRDARLFFLQVLTEADDRGRLRDEPKRLAGVLYPNDENVTPRQLIRWIGECVEVGMIHRYQSDLDPTRSFLHIANFAKHQVINRPSPSRLPRCSCEAHEEVPDPSPNGQGALTEASMPGSGSRKLEVGKGTSSSSVSEEPRVPDQSLEEEEEEEVLEGLWAAWAQHRLATRTGDPIQDRSRWLAKVRAELKIQHRARAAYLLVEHPGIAFPDLIAELEGTGPSTKPEPKRCTSVDDCPHSVPRIGNCIVLGEKCPNLVKRPEARHA